MKTTTLRLLLGGIFLAAALEKIQYPVSFAEMVEHYQLLPFQVGVWLALVLPYLELVLGLALVLGFLSRSCALLAAGLSIVFGLASFSAWWRGLDVSCGCFHSQGPPVSWIHSLLDIGLLALAILILRIGPGRWALDDFFYSD